MKRGDAVWTVRKCDYLTAPEKHVFLTLLQGADWPDCNLPEKFTPTRPEIEQWTSLSESAVKRSVKHLVSHGWLTCETGRGNGRKSRYVLVPRVPDSECHCPKVSRRPLSVVRKEVTENPYPATKGVTQTPERAHTEPSKGSRDLENSQVEPDFARKEARKEGVVVVKVCDLCSATPARDDNGGARYCASCAPHIWKDPAA